MKRPSDFTVPLSVFGLKRRRRSFLLLFSAAFLFLVGAAPGSERTVSSYDSLRGGFKKPDHAVWGEVPLWWWEGERLTKRRLTWELETLASQGVKAVCPIQRSPGRCDPPSFSRRWWELFKYVESECKRLGMRLWAYDQVGYGNYGWLEKAAAKVKDTGTFRVVFLQAEASAGKPASLAPSAKPLAASPTVTSKSTPLAGNCSPTWRCRAGA